MNSAARAGWNGQGLVERDRSALLVIDVQQYFLDKLPADNRAPLVARIGWLMEVATLLGIPVIATAEDIARDGPLVPALSARLAPNTVVHDKQVFGLMDQADIRTAIESTGRTTFVLTGLETDVCVAHSALGLEAAGYRSVVIEDATGSPPPHHAAGIARLRDAGITVTTLKGVFYEWVHDVETYHRIRRALTGPLPAGLTL
jgi:nicotinamidase-related amidase